MDSGIKSIFQLNILLLELCDKVIYYYRTQNFDSAFLYSDSLLRHLDKQMEQLFLESDYFAQGNYSVDTRMAFDIVKELLGAQEVKDYILLADLYELRLVPFLTALQELIINREEDMNTIGTEVAADNLLAIRERDPKLGKLLSQPQDQHNTSSLAYSMEFTSSGLMTLAIEKEGKKYYLHTNNRCASEAFTLANYWYTVEKTNYIIYGLGLGYHVMELAKLDSSITIEVYESNLEIIRLACEIESNKNLFGTPRFKIVYDPDFSQLAKRIEDMREEDEFLIHYPSLQIVPEGPIKEKLENYFIQYNAAKRQYPLLTRNFTKNIRHYDRFADDMKEAFEGKSLYIVAAGPSLDKNFLQLKEVGDKGIILATGTVFKKLMKAGIRPDYLLVTDPNARVYKQISGYEDCDVPMIFLSTAYFGFAANYKGKKYILCQKDYPEAEELARQKGQGLFRTGGSVSTTALDIGITLGCSRIIFLGLDLAYTDNYAHASDTSRRDAVQIQDMRQVEDIHGNPVSTSRSLDIFRVWIENRIREEKGTTFIDATEGGAKIKGMKIMKLTEVLSEEAHG